MHFVIDRRWQGIRSTGRQSLELLACWRRHEWCSLQGHWHALMERAQLARRAPSLSQLIHDQLDLLPESRRRFRRNAEGRRAILQKLGRALRQLLSGGA